MANVYVSPSPIHGTGVFAARDYAAGDAVLVIDDSRIVDDTQPLRLELGEFDIHCDYLGNGLVVLMQFPERHINHSCDPNTYVKTIASVRHVVAWREIQTGEEITYDYIINCHGGIVWSCDCGSPSCRGMIPPSFFDLPEKLQREYLPFLDDWFVQEHQEKIHALRSKAEQ